MQYFNECTCLEDLKEIYRKLCFKYHPDVNKEKNATEIMQQVNVQYKEAFEKLKNVFKSKDNESVYTDKKPVSEMPEEFINIMNFILQLKGVKMELIGRWIWLSGNTKEYKEQLKSLNFRWSSKKIAWYWHRPEDATRSRGKKTLDEIRQMYGSVEIQKDKKESLLHLHTESDKRNTNHITKAVAI